MKLYREKVLFRLDLPETKPKPKSAVYTKSDWIWYTVGDSEEDGLRKVFSSIYFQGGQHEVIDGVAYSPNGDYRVSLTPVRVQSKHANSITSLFIYYVYRNT